MSDPWGGSWGSPSAWGVSWSAETAGGPSPARPGIPRDFRLFPEITAAAKLRQQQIDEDELIMRYIRKLVESGQLEQ